jgi:hypothetical protein
MKIDQYSKQFADLSSYKHHISTFPIFGTTFYSTTTSGSKTPPGSHLNKSRNFTNPQNFKLGLILT